MNPHRLKSYLILLSVVAIWGPAGPIIKFTLEGIDPLPFLAYRFAISAILSIIFFGRKLKSGKKFRQFRANFPLVFLYGFLAAPLALGILFTGLDRTTVLDLSLIGVIGPMIVVAGGALFFGDRITRREKTGIAIVLVGVMLNSLYPVFKSEGVRLTGNLLLLLYLLADTGSILLAKRVLQKKVRSENLTNFAFIIGALTIIPLTIVLYGGSNLINSVVTLPLKYHLGVWYMALISGSLAYYLYVRGMRTIEVSEAVLFNYLLPFFTIPLAIFWLKESISLSFSVGLVIIAAGLVVAQYKKKGYNS
jgi:drug/metabolite transporter (DMT)-like permease